MRQIASLIIGLVLSTAAIHAQVNMTLLVPPTGVLQKNQLWNIALVYTGDVPLDVNINLTLLSTTDNQPLLTASSKVITLKKGTTQLKSTDLSPIQYNYLSSLFNVDRSPNGLLPVGNYTACYSIYKNEYEIGSILAEDCIPVEVAPLSPPLLNSPADEAVIETLYPQFTWIPPAPLNLFNDLSYDMLLVEVLSGQLAQDAIQQNVPVYNIGNYRNIYKNYPSTYKSLDAGKLYAWRIIAKNNNQFAGQSDVWTFRISKEQAVEAATVDGPYIQVKKGYESAFTICTGSLNFEYVNEANDSTIAYRIVSSDDGKGTTIKEGVLTSSYGQNFFSLPLHKEKRFQNGKTYMLQVFNSRNEQWNLNFSYNATKENN